jgi:transcriptional regulator with XRE-family HTH domain
VRAVHLPRYKEMLRRIREARKAAGLTQVEVAKALRKTQAFVSKCELGERRIDPLDLSDFAKLYDKPLTYFIPK